ncbi:MAG TPA: hypothetical protein VKY92_03055 [Verrucomicrobiae bacterium]|nr:hypothetical protein [Verrucomicrobiae bacterium]
MRIPRRRTLLSFRIISVSIALSLYYAGFPQLTAQAAQQITKVSTSGGNLQLQWSGQSDLYEVQTTASLSEPNWVPIFNTAGTNALLSSAAGSGFYRVMAAGTSSGPLIISMTNLTTGDIITWTSQLHTNHSDWVFDGPTNWNGAAPQIVFPSDQFTNFDVVYGAGGSFTIVTNGQSTGYGGWVTTTPGPGPGEVTHTGLLTNGTAAVSFSAVDDPSVVIVILGIAAVVAVLALAEAVLTCVASSVAGSVSCALSGRQLIAPPKITWTINPPFQNKLVGIVVTCDFCK